MLFIVLKIKMYFGTADYKALFKIDFIGLWFISVLNHEVIGKILAALYTDTTLSAIKKCL